MMKTIINKPSPPIILEAVDLLKSGDIVALPTETVYGLAGNALNPSAIEKIFTAKNRPQDNPLIVHVTGMDMVQGLGLEIPEIAHRLAEKFWVPSRHGQAACGGPLSMILRKTNNTVPPEVSCGLDSVAVRVPDSPIMLEIIEKCGFPLAAPSANLSGSPSPTTAQHVFADLGGKIPLIVDGGECRIGLESTVIIFEQNMGLENVGGDAHITPQNNQTKIKILRPGAITAEMLQEFAPVIIDDVVVGANCVRPPISPGVSHRHYSPKAEVIAVIGELPIAEHTIETPEAHTLYAQLRKFDELGAEKIYIKLPEKAGIGLALYNRIIRAANFNIIGNTNE
ncbi:MAG: L-threonylcarbamoyladenylate synthase [Oscillospiraceae bacterium]|nr:L-threonylcarbamoyladenylate synthase [Oscillospiraceae bacterium]